MLIFLSDFGSDVDFHGDKFFTKPKPLKKISIQYIINMTKLTNLPKPTVFHPRVKTSKRSVPLVEYRYWLGTQSKKNVDKLMRKKLKEMLAKAKGPISVELAYWMDKPYTSDFFTIRDEDDIKAIEVNDAHMYDSGKIDGVFRDKANVKALSIITKPVGKLKGGADDKHNDCLYNCLLEGFLEKPKVLESAAKFKEWLGIGRDDKIAVEFIPMIEDELQMRINLTGVHTYISRQEYPKCINITLYDEHYDVQAYTNCIDDYNALKSGYYETKNRCYPICYKIDDSTGKAHCCRITSGRLDKKQRKGEIVSFDPTERFISRFYKHGSLRKNYFLCPVYRSEKVEEDGTITYYRKEPEDVVEEYTQKAVDFTHAVYNVLKHEASGCFNMFRSHFKYRPMATHFFYKTAPKCISNCDDFVCSQNHFHDEQYWLINSMKGGLLYSSDEKVDKCYEHDVNSFYPSLMLECDFITRKPQFESYKELPELTVENDTYTLWRCKVYKQDNRLFQKSRKHSKKYFYCGLDLITAQKEGYKIKLIQDKYHNCMRYTKDTRLKGKEVFSKFVKTIYKLKKAGVEGSKEMLNCLWGFLFSRNVYKLKSWNGDVVVKDPDLIKRMYMTDKRDKAQYCYEVFDHKVSSNGSILKQRLKFRYARFVPFLCALGRYKMANVIRPIKEHILRIHTDGFLTTKKLKDLDFGDELGQWKTSKWYDVNIHNVNNIDVSRKKKLHA